MNISHHDLPVIKEKMLSAQKIIITAHQNPDGDAVGSTLGLYHAIKKINQNLVLALPDPFPPFLQWLPGADQYLFYELHADKIKDEFSKADLIFCLDYNGPSRTGGMAPLISNSSATKVMIDHHPDPENFCTYTINIPSECSTCQLVFRFLFSLGWDHHIDADSATALYTGIMTDTGSFRFSSTTALTHRIIATLIEKGANNSFIHSSVFDTSSENRLRLTGYSIYEKLVVLPEHGAAYISLTKDELEKFNCGQGDTEGLVNYGLAIKGINMAAIFMEKDAKVKISFRSKGNIPVNELMQQHFAGGGHKNAAGGSSNLTLNETIEKFLSIIPEFMQKYNHA